MNSTKTLDEIGMAYHTPNAKSGKYEGGDKLSDGQNFTSFYHKIMSLMRDDKIKLLEIGIFNGKSIAMWADYFSNGTIYGIDQDLIKFEYNISTLFEQGAFKSKKLTHIYADRYDLHVTDFLPNNDVKIIKCNTLSENFEMMIKYLGDFNIIIDDGNHNAQSQCRNFELLFEKITPGGMYIIEDIIQPTEFYSPEYFTLYFDKPGLIKSRQEKIDEIKKLDLINSDTLGQQFDEMIKIKRQLIPLIDKIEKRPNNIIFYRK